MNDKFIKTQALYSLIDWEPFVLLGCLLAITWIFYKFFLQAASPERHTSIRSQFQALFRHFFILTILFVLFIVLHTTTGGDLANFARITPYIGLMTFVWGSIVFVKTCRLLVLQYLFLGSMRAGVPLLLVNIFSLLLSIVLTVWALSQVFGLDLGPLMATSAAFSIVLGLALQDTLGNLFAGISLQIDKSYEIGDWLEVVQGVQRATGQVKEISWRSTILVGFSDEEITLPNRTMANAQISNFSPDGHPIVRSQLFRIPYGCDLQKAKDILERAVVEISDIRGLPAPLAYIQETNENWVAIKVIYFIDNFGGQFTIGDKVMRKGIDALRANGIELARNVIELHSKSGPIHEQNS
ncbi:mechanosensitive ion channel family protein [Bdellovibrio sp. HCB337]|uniref:mechanosensitive ion channel family protein n=1 Tax=Bdellovibrio sp. HCB337 TaxID=3394358 RepID=UPI0039A7178A